MKDITKRFKGYDPVANNEDFEREARKERRLEIHSRKMYEKQAKVIS